jgi:GMP synthase-like glutamine amidotransferase
MKPIALIQHTEVGAPGALQEILRELGHDTHTVRVFAGDAIPQDAQRFSGVVLLGGSMGVHDPLPWIPDELGLIRSADRLGLPLAGHCLGSQMLAYALGGSVTRHVRAEIGWGAIEAHSGDEGREWWGDLAGRSITTFQWHQDTFTAPAGAVRLASGAHCDSQVFVLRGRHLLVQSHLEISPALVAATLQKNRTQLQRQLELGNPAVQAADDMLRTAAENAAQANAALLRLYRRWTQGCV